MDREFLKERIALTKTLIVAYEDAATQLSSGAVQSYSLNTGQTTQNVTRFDVARLNGDIDGLYNRLATLEARLNGSGVVIARPGW